jgi:feruloyl-CoA synthase
VGFLTDHPPVIVDWLPWNHTFGGNHNLNMMLRNGGTLYIDEGKPVPALIGRTVANLREVSPTVYFNVPRGYAALVDYLEKDERCGRNSSPASTCCSTRPPPCRRACGIAWRSWGSRCAGASAVHLLLGPDRDGAGGDHGALCHRSSRQHRRAGAGHGGEARPVGDKLEIRVKGPTSRPATSRRRT